MDWLALCIAIWIVSFVGCLTIFAFEAWVMSRHHILEWEDYQIPWTSFLIPVINTLVLIFLIIDFKNKG